MKFFKINYNRFFDCSYPEFCYLLGYLWADSTLIQNSVRLEIIESDGIIVKEILDSIDIHYSLHKRPAKTGRDGVNRQARYTFCFGGELYLFLCQLNFNKKSYYSHQKVMELIPTENLHYWMRGYFDGDGCFYHNPKKYLKQASIASTHEQDWNYLDSFIKSLGINTFIKRKIHNKKSKDSVLRFFGPSISIFGSYIYQGKQFGLQRKKDKYLAMIT